MEFDRRYFYNCFSDDDVEIEETAKEIISEIGSSISSNILSDIGNIIGAPTCQYNKEIERTELLERMNKIAKLIEEEKKYGKTT